MGNNYLLILGIVDKLNEWNEQLNQFTKEHFDNVGAGTLIFLGLVAFGFWAIRTFSKKS